MGKELRGRCVSSVRGIAKALEPLLEPSSRPLPRGALKNHGLHVGQGRFHFLFQTETNQLIVRCFGRLLCSQIVQAPVACQIVGI
jgi:hypothetical protein